MSFFHKETDCAYVAEIFFESEDMATLVIELEEDHVQIGSLSASALNDEETNSTRKANATKILTKFKICLISN